MNPELLAKAKSLGFSDRQIAHLTGQTEDAVRAERKRIGLVPSYRLVDTCAAEFEAYTPYYYSSYDRGDDEVTPSSKRKVMILGGGPNRIGQGIEFDYCCVHASFALKEDGFETLMVNSNPETVSTDYDTSDKLFFEPLTLEDVLHIYEREKCWGAIAQFGGQTPLNLALGLQKNGVNIIGTSPQSIETAEDRKLFAAMLNKLNIPQPPNGLATNEAEALVASKRLGYPVLVRPSFVLGGRAMQIVYSDNELSHYMRFAVEASPERPVLVDKFLEDATEVDVDCIADVGHFDDASKGTIVIGGMLEHIEFAGVHSGDAAMVLPPHTLSQKVIDQIREYTHAMARELKVIGLMNVQYAVKDEVVYVLEVREQVHRRAAGETGGEGNGWEDAQGTRLHAGNLDQVLGGEGIRVSVQPFSWAGHIAFARNAVHRRSHGARRGFGHGLREVSNGSQREPALQRAGVHQRQRRRQKERGGTGAAVRRPRLSTDCHRRNRLGLGKGRADSAAHL
jgi:carbamoyl-phosphate synthase large subunit